MQTGEFDYASNILPEENKRFKDVYPGEGIRALSWKQPFASLMLHGKAETRTWDTKYRGWVLICASKVCYSVNAIADIAGPQQYKRIEEVLVKEYFTLPLGQAIAIGRLKGTGLMANIVRPRPDSEEPHDFLVMATEKATFVQYNPALWIHSYEDVQPIVPFEWKGSQGWKTLDQATIDKIILL